MDNGRPQSVSDLQTCVEQVLSQVGKRIVLCAPIAVGKPVALVNEFYRRAAADPAIDLTILTGLTMHRPRGHSELERRFIEPMATRVFGDMPEPEWVAPLQKSALPANIAVHEFFMEPGAYLTSALAQQSYASINYTHVARAVTAGRRECHHATDRAARDAGGRERESRLESRCHRGHIAALRGEAPRWHAGRRRRSSQ